MLNSKSTIIFDLDNTLIVEDSASQEAFNATCKSFSEISQVDYNKLFHSVNKYSKEIWESFYLFDYCEDIQITPFEALCADFLGGEDERLKELHHWGPIYRKQTWHNALLDNCINDKLLSERLAEKYKIELRKRFYPIPGVITTLNKLMQYYRLAILTNGAPDLQREKIFKAGLENYFEVIIVSGEIGVGKPNPLIFSAVLDKMRISPLDAVMVGDNLERDIAGANQVGITSVWVNPENITNREHKPDYEINKITDLIEFLSIKTYGG